MKKEPKKKKEKGIFAYYVELESPLDLARHSFGYTPGHVKAIKEGGKFKLISMGEKFVDVRLIYYTTVDRISSFFVYNPGSSDSKERFEIREKVPQEQSDFKSYKAPIVELLSNPYTESKDLKKGGKVMKIEVKDFNAFVKSLANYAQDDEPPPKLYSFFSGKDHIIGTFDFFHEGGAKIFTFAKTNIKETFSALSYSYITDLIEPVNSFVEKSTVYIRVINLKKPFPFF